MHFKGASTFLRHQKVSAFPSTPSSLLAFVLYGILCHGNLCKFWANTVQIPFLLLTGVIPEPEFPHLENVLILKLDITIVEKEQVPNRHAK